MKRYIILSSTIRNMGGAQMYAANKLTYMESLGWKPDMYFFNQGIIKIEYLRRFKDNLIPELKKPLISCSTKTKEKVIDRVLCEVSEDDEIIIETHMPHLAFWGELLAQRCKGKNVLFFIEEKLPKFNYKEIEFLDYKIGRREIMNSGVGLKKILQSYYDDSKYKDYGFTLKAYCNNVIDYSSVQLPSEILNGDYSILSIGRLDKPYIKPMLNEILLFAKEHHNKRINFIVIGGDASNEMPDYIHDLFGNTANVSLYLLGYVFPVPYDWVKVADVSIASSNSILVTADVGIPTIGIDITDDMPIGLYRLTTSNLWHRKDEPIRNISQWLDDVLVKKMYTKELHQHSLQDDLDNHLRPHIEFLKLSDQSKDYYDVERMYSEYDKARFIIKKFLIEVVLTFKKGS